MKIFVDLNSLARQLTGIETYALHFASSLLQYFPEHEYHLLFRKEIHSSFLKYKGKKSRLIQSLFNSQLLTEQIFIPLYCAKNKIDICIFPGFPPSPFIYRPIMFFCYDATMWLFPKTISLKNKLYFKPLAEIALRRANKVFTVSESSKQGIVDTFPQVANKVINIKSALPGRFSRIPEKEAVSCFSELGIKRPFLLSVGSLEPRKNILFTLRALAPIFKEKKVLLVLVGRNAWGTDDISKEIERLALKKYVVRTGYISMQILQCLYSTAEAFIFPSLYEGFGFPILEAFSCGCPVISSNTSSIPEVTDDAALLINPHDENGLRKAVISVMENPSLCNELREKGFKRAAYFSWKDCAVNFFKHQQ
ncbi:MAG: glycosyltransferase family 1 protein [Chitinispirillaceae bacterium]|jgi:glycosyltransferase involved in cell wall biosynthesis